ncbi:MAG: hypothetical protein Q8O56_01760 [Solirubrobacteraceae bacterium]|nr:hypothetical protein [Solirubrobacteraceae bacterium]
MPSRAQTALLLSGLLAIGAIATGLDLVIARSCETGDRCAGSDVAWVIGVPLVLLGIGMLIALVAGWSARSGLVAQATCTVWAGALLIAAGAIGGAANVIGVLLAVLAVAMGALSVWVPR